MIPLRDLQRVVDGMDQAEAGRIMFSELGRPMPAHLLGEPS